MKPHLLRLSLLALTISFAPIIQSAEPLQLTNISWSANGFSLGWQYPGAGTSCVVQAKEDLVNGLWFPAIADRPWPTLSNVWTDITAVSNGARFYRVLGVSSAERGKILGSTNHLRLPLTLLAYLYSTGTLPVPPQYGVNGYKINYETLSPLGGKTRASGVLFLPQNNPGPLPLVSYQHGTITRTNDAPSVNTNSAELLIGIAFATTGYAAVLPDYVGLGESEGLQPYHHAISEATAGVDMLRAGRTYCASNNVSLSSKLFLCGYSHGGHATMALFRELETYHTNEFTVTACAPMAGAYDLSGATTEDVLSGRIMPNPYYFAILLAAYQDVYHLAPTLGDLLVPPYNATLPPLLRGNASGGTINAAMPNPALAILRPEILQAFTTNTNHVLRQALRANDLHRWVPRAPMRMYHCGGDTDVVIANSLNALAAFQMAGATQVELIIPSQTASHGDCVEPSLTAAKAWFDSLR